eukprot:COSAG02_NODE_48886_length_330_cov_1.571429_1_plen_44_part_01
MTCSVLTESETWNPGQANKPIPAPGIACIFDYVGRGGRPRERPP